MKHLFVEVRYQGRLEYPLELLESLPSHVVLAASIQYLEFLEDFKTFLEKGGKTVHLFQSRHGRYPGQVLGCDVFEFTLKDGKHYDAFVYLGDGLFHPTALLFTNRKPVHIYNPMSQKVDCLNAQYLERLEKRRNGMLSKFIVSKTVGVLVTRKPGQNQAKAVDIFRQEMQGKGKEIVVFYADHLDTDRLEDFNFIDVWVNTACPRMEQDFKCVNLRDLQEIGFFSGSYAVF